MDSDSRTCRLPSFYTAPSPPRPPTPSPPNTPNEATPVVVIDEAHLWTTSN